MHPTPFHATRRRLIASGILASTLAAAGGLAQAADFPDRPLTLVAPYPAGGAADVLARILGKSLQEQLGQPVVVENKPGAATMLAAAQVATSPPDATRSLRASSTR